MALQIYRRHRKECEAGRTEDFTGIIPRLRANLQFQERPAAWLTASAT